METVFRLSVRADFPLNIKGFGDIRGVYWRPLWFCIRVTIRAVKILWV